MKQRILRIIERIESAKGMDPDIKADVLEDLRYLFDTAD